MFNILSCSVLLSPLACGTAFLECHVWGVVKVHSPCSKICVWNVISSVRTEGRELSNEFFENSIWNLTSSIRNEGRELRDVFSKIVSRILRRQLRALRDVLILAGGFLC